MGKPYPYKLRPLPYVLSRCKHILLQILEILRTSASTSTSDGNDAHASFWATYQHEASAYDDEFVETYKSDMDIVLIFAGLFSAVSTTFIVAMEPNLSPDPNETTNALLMLLIHTIDNNTFSNQTLTLPGWDGPGSTVIWIQSLIYASLSASLLAALGAVLGKRW
ncbi:hypothetical protein HYDPIDRAFT_91617, partial [Hydnomerulius pinastri MD-312]